MAIKPKAMAVAETMVDYAKQVPPIPYSQYDCYKIVRQAVRDNGGDMQYSGSNDVYRNGCEWVMPLYDAIAQEKLLTGMVLFIVEPDSDSTPAKYRGDGKGDASHMGLFTGLTDLETGVLTEVVHSSASRGGVYPSTLKNAWNWAGKLKDVDYSEWTEFGESTDSEQGGASAKTTPSATQYATVDVPEGENLRMREIPASGGKYMLKIPRGTELTIIAHKNGFGQTTYRGFTGWVDERYLRYVADGAAEKHYTVKITHYGDSLLNIDRAAEVLDKVRYMGYGGEVVG